MKYFKVQILTLLILCSCSTSDKDRTDGSSNGQQLPTEEISASVPEMAKWADDYIIEYLEANSDRLTEVDGKPVTYMKHVQIRNDRDYAVVKIGHSFEHRYIADQWIFIDSLTKEIYEYDLPNDSLILWTGNVKTINPTGTYILDSDTTIRDGET